MKLDETQWNSIIAGRTGYTNPGAGWVKSSHHKRQRFDPVQPSDIKVTIRKNSFINLLRSRTEDFAFSLCGYEFQVSAEFSHVFVQTTIVMNSE